jgi:hypothetical protein
LIAIDGRADSLGQDRETAHVIAMLMRDENGPDIVQGPTDFAQSMFNLAGAETGIDEDSTRFRL